MRISDWSSDVCSSDLCRMPLFTTLSMRLGRSGFGGSRSRGSALCAAPEFPAAAAAEHAGAEPAHRKPDDERDPERLPTEREQLDGFRSEERRVGKGGVSTCRMRWTRDD